MQVLSFCYGWLLSLVIEAASEKKQSDEVLKKLKQEVEAKLREKDALQTKLQEENARKIRAEEKRFETFDSGGIIFVKIKIK